MDDDQEDPREDKRTNDALRQLDAECVERGAPILSVLIRHPPSYEPISVFWESVNRYGLRRGGESDAELVARLTEEAFAYAKRNIQ